MATQEEARQKALNYKAKNIPLASEIIPPNKIPSLKIINDRTSKEYEEITYDHDIYRNVGLSNPGLGYVWIGLPNFEGLDTPEQLMAKIARSKPEDLKQNIQELYIEPQNLISFSFTRFLFGIGNFSFSLYDNNYTEIEEKLLLNKGLITFQYGYSSNREMASPWHIGFVTAYSLKFNLEGTYITFGGVSTGWALNSIKQPIASSVITQAANDSEKNKIILISDFVRQLALKANFPENMLVIEPTKAVVKRGTNLKDNEKGAIPLNALTGDSTFEHILQTLIPYSINDEGQGGYTFYVETTKNGPELHFHTLNYVPNTENSEEKIKRIKLFTQFKHPNTVVRNFQPNWSMSMVQLRKGGKSSVISYGMTNKKITKIEKTITDGKINTVGGEKTQELPTIPKSPEAHTETYYVASDSIVAGQAVLENAMTPEVLQSISGVLTIQGTPVLRMLETIAVHVYIPKGKHSVDKETGDRLIHWISGDFRIIKITDNISKGDYTTTLELGVGGREIIGNEKVAKFAVGKVINPTTSYNNTK